MSCVLTDVFVNVIFDEAASYENVPTMCASGRPPPVRSIVAACVAATSFVVNVARPPWFVVDQVPSSAQLGVASALLEVTPTATTAEITERNFRMESLLIDFRLGESFHVELGVIFR